MSMRAAIRMHGLPHIVASLGALEYSVQTGEPASATLDPGGLWGYLQKHPDEAAAVNQAMRARANALIASVLAAYNFTPFGTIADIADGLGHLPRLGHAERLRALAQAQGLTVNTGERQGRRSAAATSRACEMHRAEVTVCDCHHQHH